MYVLEFRDVLELMRMEYAEMPQLRLTFWQAQHLWNLSNEQCEQALAALTASGFLAQTHDGAYIRRESVVTHLHKLWEARYSDTL
jgi:ribulose bisphosphate carboxylase small subunit